ncbi:hypothetical protein F4805DRAFT_49899 [Annulohypoxylon moriforme]|nr:hypothetical protein F4805DRAFT_49899 [Annulohypoxylon moriforme]
MPKSTKTSKAGRTVPAAKFPKFFQLPVELQLMIWRLYWPPTKHFFTVYSGSVREYGSIDSEDYFYVNRLASKTKDKMFSFIPFLSKIRFVNDVKVRLVGKRPEDRLYAFDIRKVVNRPEVYVDFERDIFYFDYCTRLSSQPWTPGDEWFRFLRKPINILSSSNSLKGHWIFKVKNLALCLSYKGIRGSTWDHQILQGMKSLKKVWLVTPQIPRGHDHDDHHNRRNRRNRHWRPVQQDPIADEPFLTFDDAPHINWDEVNANGKATQDYLQEKMKKYGIEPELIITTTNNYGLYESDFSWILTEVSD